MYKQEKRAVLLKAKALLDVAESEHRDLTVAEKNQVDGYIREAKSFDEAASRWAKYPDLKDLLGPGAQVGVHGYSGSGSWSKAFKATGGKALLTPSGAVGVPSLSSVLPTVGERLETILQVMPTLPSDGNASVEYLREDTRTQAADTVAEGAQKPESTYELSEQTAIARTIAHLSKPAPKQWFSDSGGNLDRYLDVVMRQGLQLALETQVINGSGAGADIEGMLQVSGIMLQGFDTDVLTTCRKAITTLQSQNIPTDNLVFVLHPDDWERAELTEATGSGVFKMNGGQQNNLPVQSSVRRLWNVPVALSNGITSGVGMLFDRAAVQLYEHEQVAISWSENVYDSQTQLTDFQTNQIRWRAEGRWMLAIYRPASIVELDLLAGS